jgi:putative restriction endonuclease
VRRSLPLRGFIGVTDRDWFELLRAQPQLDEVNFWQPGGQRVFGALAPGELFFFKLHAPHNFIVGGGVFAHATLLPVSLAWSSFGIANGARTLSEMRDRIAKYRRGATDRAQDYTIGSILLEQPFFLDESEWLPVPHDWSPNIVQGKGYDLAVEPGINLMRALRERRSALRAAQPELARDRDERRYGEAQLVRPRLGQGSFRVIVTDAYERRCAITGERVLPVLEAAHIRPFALGGEHRTDNGLLLRSDIHTLFDRGYVTVAPDLRVEISPRIRSEFENGRDYYALHGRAMRVPERALDRPAIEQLRWHNDELFLR